VTAAGQSLVDEVHRRVLTGTWSGSAAPDARGHLAGLVHDVEPLLGAAETSAAVEGVLARVSGLGALQPLVVDPEVAEVMVNGDGQVWVERGGALERTPLRMEPDAVAHLIERILAPLGRRIDRTSPVVDARLADGSRVNAVVAPVAVDGPCLTIRRFSARPIGLHEVAGPDVAALLRGAVRSRCNLLVSGGAGAGKTTLLNALAAEIDPAARVVTIEDAAELRLPGEHVVRLEASPGTAEGVGAVSTRALVRNALRMRPDRIIVGEVRGAEALDMLQAMNSGHEGSLSTCHANSPDDALRRVETMCLLEDGHLPLAAVREQVVSALDLVVQIARQPDGTRAVRAVAEVVDRCRTEVGGPADRCHPGTRLLADGQTLVAQPERAARWMPESA
jgi:pilus assembly protein CpaF